MKRRFCFFVLPLLLLLLSGCGSRVPVLRDQEAVLAWIEALPADETALAARGAAVKGAEGSLSADALSLWKSFRRDAEAGRPAAFFLRWAYHIQTDYYICCEGQDCRLLVLPAGREVREYKESSLPRLLTLNRFPVEELEPWDPAAYPTYPSGRDADEILSCFSAFPPTSRELRRMTELPISSDGYGRDPGAWARFYESVSAGEPACVSFAMLTVEGDPVYCYLDYDGTDFYLLKDSAFDSYGGGYYEARYTALTEKSSPLGERTDGKTGRYLQYTLSGGEWDQVIFCYRALDE